jgi:hypothetical protein
VSFCHSVKKHVLESCSDKVKGYLGFKTSGSIGGVQDRKKDGSVVRRPKDNEFVGVLGIKT